MPGIRPSFEKIDLRITLHTDEPPERVAKLQKNVAFRCPVTIFMHAADVDFNVTWKVAD